MGRKKVREEKSKLKGTKAVLKQLNTAAHTEEHQKSSPGSPGGTNFVGVAKMGWGESSGVIGS